MKKLTIILIILVIPVIMYADEVQVWRTVEFGMSSEQVQMELNIVFNEQVEIENNNIVERWKVNMDIG